MQVIPFNTFYPRLEVHSTQVDIYVIVNKWDHILFLGMVKHNETFVHLNGIFDIQVKGTIVL
jgi:TBCC domain-containing protein 1